WPTDRGVLGMAAAVISNFTPGFRLIDGSELNALVQALNNIQGNGTPGPITGTTGTFSGNLSALGFASMPLLPEAAVAAAGSAIGNAIALPSGVANVSGADGTKGVQLPAGVAAGSSKVCVVLNATDGVLKVYPPTGGTINSLTANSSYSVANLTGAVLLSVS